MNPLVSVIIPAFNHAQYISRAIESVLDQDYDNFELIVVDDGSTDQTREILRQLPSNPRMVILINDVNRGQSAVVNQALRIAEGQFICVLPSDDWYLPNKLSIQVARFAELGDDVGVVYGKGYRYYEDTFEMLSVNLPMYSGWVLEKFVREPNFVYPVTPMFRRGCFEYARPDESYRAEGEAIYVKFATKYKFDYVDEFVGVMRDHSYNTGKMTEMMYRDNIRYWSEFFDRDSLPEGIKKLRAVPISRLHRLKGLEAIMLDLRLSDGRAALVSAIKNNYSLVFDAKVIAGLVISLFPLGISSRLISLWQQRRVGADN